MSYFGNNNNPLAFPSYNQSAFPQRSLSGMSNLQQQQLSHLQNPQGHQGDTASAAAVAVAQQQQQQQQHQQQHQQHQHQNQHQHPQYQQPQPYQELSRKKSDPLSSPSPSKATTRNTLYLTNHYATSNEHIVLPNKPKGPKELQIDDQSKLLSPLLTRRIPLKTRNSENSDYDSNGYYSDQYKSSPTRFLGNNYKKRVTDELERLSLEKRNIPEFEELYIRKNRH